VASIPTTCSGIGAGPHRRPHRRRLYYVAFNLDYYRPLSLQDHRGLEGGLAIHGGVLGGLLVGGGYALWKGLPAITYMTSPRRSLALGQAVGRWGNFFNEERSAPDGSAVEALHLAAPPPAPVRPGGILSSDVSL